MDCAEQFLGAGRVRALQPLGRGLINATYLVEGPDGQQVLQRLNPRVFQHPERILHNLRLLQQAADQAGAEEVRVPHLLPVRESTQDSSQNSSDTSDLLIRDAEGHAWRLLEYIHPSQTLDRINHRQQALEVGRCLGAFHHLGDGLPVAEFLITLPGSRDTAAHLARLREAVSAHLASLEANERTRAEQLIAFIEVREAIVTALAEALAAGRTRRRVIHGDPKLDNILFSPSGEQALCLIDLDTVQPGLVQHDLADCLRSCCRRQDAGNEVSFDLDIAEAILTGYAERLGGCLDAEEIALIPVAIRQIPLELCIRFLADHLNGDRYFRVNHRGENLEKAEIQAALLVDIERKAPQIQALIDQACKTQIDHA